MSTAPSTAAPVEPRVPRAILWGGLICGFLDINAAFIDVWLSNQTGPVKLLQGVASAVLGRAAALDGSFATAALGLAMHFTVAFSATTIFYQLSRRFPVLVRHAVPSGLIYGALVFLVMFRVVLPLMTELRMLYLSHVTFAWPKLRWQQFIIHLICVGLPIALTVRHFVPRDKQTA